MYDGWDKQGIYSISKMFICKLAHFGYTPLPPHPFPLIDCRYLNFTPVTIKHPHFFVLLTHFYPTLPCYTH